MNLTKLKEVIKVLETLDVEEPESDNSELMQGRYVIVRSRNEGINAGYLKRAERGLVELSAARRIWYHKPKDKNLSWYEGVAESGLSSDSKISGSVDKIIVEDYSITFCTDKARKSIIGHPTHEQ